MPFAAWRRSHCVMDGQHTHRKAAQRARERADIVQAVGASYGTNSGRNRANEAANKAYGVIGFHRFTIYLSRSALSTAISSAVE